MKVIINHPSVLVSLFGSAKKRWKQKHHMIRWEKRYSKKYPAMNGKLFKYDGFFIKEEL